MNHRALLLSFVLLVACSRGQILPGKARPEAFPCPDNTACASVIDAPLNDTFSCRLTPVTLAEPKELCRRLYVDTTGRLPTPEDFAEHCEGQSQGAIVDYLLGTDEYVLSRQMLWGARFGYNDQRAWYASIIGLDTLVGELYRGKEKLSDGSEHDFTLVDFVNRAAIHPGLLLSADDTLAANVARTANPSIDPRELASGPSADAFAIRVFQTLLFRSPTMVELGDFANLYRPYEIDPSGADDRPGMNGFKARRLRVQPCNCTGPKAVNCRSVFGQKSVTMQLRFPGTANCSAELKNAFYIEKAGADEQAILTAPGVLLPQLDDFYTAYVKEALDRLLGYDAIAALGDTTGPRVRKALADALKTTGSVRDLEANIFKSVLYRQMQAPPASSPPVDCNGKESPLFAGPVKRMGPTAFLQSLLSATGADFGKCDHRVQTQTYAKNIGGVPVTAYAPPASVYYYPVKDAATSEPNFSYRDLARTIGACADNVDGKAVLDESAFTLIGMDRLTRKACEEGSKVLPSGATGADDAALGAIVDYQFNRIFLADPTADERSAAITAMKSCISAGQSCTADVVGKRFCSALLKSARFLTY